MATKTHCDLCDSVIGDKLDKFTYTERKSDIRYRLRVAVNININKVAESDRNYQEPIDVCDNCKMNLVFSTYYEYMNGRISNEVNRRLEIEKMKNDKGTD